MSKDLNRKVPAWLGFLIVVARGRAGRDLHWPDPSRPGVPMFPHRDGWHYINNDMLYWRAQEQKYALNSVLAAALPPHKQATSVYCGTLFTQTDVRELLGAQRARFVAPGKHDG